MSNASGMGEDTEPKWRSRRLAARLATVLAALAGTLLPASPSGAAGAPQGFAFHGSRNGSAVVSLSATGRWRLTMLRPVTGLVVIELVSLDRADYSFSAVALPSGDIDTSWFDSHGGGFSSTSVAGPPPRWVTAAPVRLAAGRYLVTLLTKHPTKAVLAPVGRRGLQLRSVAASGKTDAGEASTSVSSPTASQTARQTLDFNVPAGAHQVLLIATTTWSGSRTIDYDDLCYSAGVAHSAPCGDPQFAATNALNPGSPTTSWSEFEMLISQPTTTGAGTANFYFAVTGKVSRRTLIAIGLP